MTPVKAVIVLPFGSEIQMDHYRQVFGEWSVWVTPDNDSLWQVIADANPDVIISLGHLGTGSGLWALPLWRRRTWLHLTDAKIGPEDVFTSALSLMMSLLEIEPFTDSPLVSVVPLGDDPTQMAESVRLITSGQDYDNIEILVPSKHWNNVRDLSSGHIVITMLRQIPDALENSTNCRLRSALGATRGTIVWPVSMLTDQLPPDFLGVAVDTFVSSDDVHSLIFGRDLCAQKVIDSVELEKDWELRHLLFEQSFVLGMRKYVESFPVESLGVLLCLLALEPSSKFVESGQSSTINENLFRVEPDSTRNKMLRGAVGFARHTLASK